MHFRNCILFFALLLTLQACKTGASTVPELAAILFESLQQQNQENFFKTVPKKAEYEAAYANFYVRDYEDKTQMRKDAKDKAAAMHVNLANNFKQLISDGKEKQIDWKNTKIRDLKYSTKDRKEGFQETKVRMILETGIDKNVVLFDAIQYEKRWFIVENLRWEE
ncbi:MAG: hypothetical protein EOP53_05240 [Sphingobacteriales bacterium]|nr:MAG: hypothetical protein EOP53_05240 [Sphingobacteriales bacterium]